MSAILPITLYGVTSPELSAEELSELVQLRAEWPELSLCLICLQNNSRAKIEQQLESNGEKNKTPYNSIIICIFLDFGPAILVDDQTGFTSYVKSCLQNHLVSACMRLNEVLNYLLFCVQF